MQGKKLVIFVPGLGGDVESWKLLRERLQQEEGFGPEEADWIEFEHGLKAWSHRRMEAEARELRAWIDAHWDGRHPEFDEVVLVGHSLGGLLVRKAYLQAVGRGGWNPAAWSG